MFKWQGNVTTSSQLRRGSTTKGNFTHYRLAGEAGHVMTCNVQNAYCLLKCERLVIWESFCYVNYTLYLKFLWNIYPTQCSVDEGTPPNLKCSSATTNGKKRMINITEIPWMASKEMRDFQIYNSSHSVTPSVLLCWTFDVGIE